MGLIGAATGMFLPLPSDRLRLPVLLLSGFLGSGKTTLINALLADPHLADTAVAVNEFGEIPLDQHLIDHGAERTVVLANGCLCCNLAGDFEDAAMRVFARRAAGAIPRFARLVIEPSGLADPAPIAQAILRNPVLSRMLRLEAILAAADATAIEAQLDRHPEAARQLAMADLVVLTKTDLVAPTAVARVTALLAANVTPAPILTQGLAFDALPAGFRDPATPTPVRPRRPFADRPFADPADAPAGHLGATEAVALTAAAPLRWRPFESWLREIRLTHAAHLLRVKGLLDIEATAGPVLIQGVGHVLAAPVARAAWPDQDRRSRLVLILRGAPGRPIHGGSIRDRWARALPDLLAPAP